jgi:hypothetical protein
MKFFTFLKIFIAVGNFGGTMDCDAKDGLILHRFEAEARRLLTRQFPWTSHLNTLM